MRELMGSKKVKTIGSKIIFKQNLFSIFSLLCRHNKQVKKELSFKYLHFSPIYQGHC